MIGRLRGFLLEKDFSIVLIEVGGVSYEMHMPECCWNMLPDIGKETVIFTHYEIRKDENQLFGFNNKSVRSLFRNLIKINGIGPKLALLILSKISIKQFIYAIKKQIYLY